MQNSLSGPFLKMVTVLFESKHESIYRIGSLVSVTGALLAVRPRHAGPVSTDLADSPSLPDCRVYDRSCDPVYRSCSYASVPDYRHEIKKP